MTNAVRDVILEPMLSLYPPPGRLRARIEQALGRLPLRRHDIAGVGAHLADTWFPRKGKFTPADASFFDFHGNIHAVVAHFAGDGLVLDAYLRAAVLHPVLFTTAPAAVIRHVAVVVHRFSARGLTTGDYLSAALTLPALFTTSPATVIDNIHSVADHFRPHRLTLKDYLAAACQEPSLFATHPATVIGHITGGARRFAVHGLSVSDYLQAALRQPSLFTLAPATIQANIERVVQLFRKQGLSLTAYLAAARKHPPLFTQPPATTIAHIHALCDLQRRGLVSFPGQDDTPGGAPLHALFAFLVQNPVYCCLADDDYALRAWLPPSATSAMPASPCWSGRARRSSASWPRLWPGATPPSLLPCPRRQRPAATANRTTLPASSSCPLLPAPPDHAKQAGRQPGKQPRYDQTLTDSADVRFLCHRSVLERGAFTG